MLRVRALALARVCKATGARLVLISGARDNPALHEVAPFMTRVPWSLEGVGAALAAADVAIAPLDEGPYAQGKCAYKLLQYAATGLPVVGSPTGANALALSRFDGLAARPDIDGARIGLIGHSEGGIFAPMAMQDGARAGLRAMTVHVRFLDSGHAGSGLPRCARDRDRR